jgi:hypothetical protein
MGDETWCFACGSETERQSSECVGETSPSAEETEISKVPHQDHVDNSFDSQGMVNKEFVPEGGGGGGEKDKTELFEREKWFPA